MRNKISRWTQYVKEKLLFYMRTIFKKNGFLYKQIKRISYFREGKIRPACSSGLSRLSGRTPRSGSVMAVLHPPSGVVGRPGRCRWGPEATVPAVGVVVPLAPQPPFPGPSVWSRQGAGRTGAAQAHGTGRVFAFWVPDRPGLGTGSSGLGAAPGRGGAVADRQR